MNPIDFGFMQHALREARQAAAAGEVPVGAIITASDLIIARGQNQIELMKDPTAHAEMLAITAAADYLGAKYLNQCTLYVTLEPCAMCAGAIGWAQIGTLVYAASDDKRGYTKFAPLALHPKTVVRSGLMAEEAAQLMKHFFEKRR